jgi:CHAD domain-containing protein
MNKQNENEITQFLTKMAHAKGALGDVHVAGLLKSQLESLTKVKDEPTVISMYSNSIRH